jgi:hypothetical protein
MKLVITLRIIAFLILLGFVAIPIASWVDNWISGEPISIHWTFWVGLGASLVLLLIAEEIKGRVKKTQ